MSGLERLIASLDDAPAGSSDFDLNPEIRPPEHNLRPAAVLVAVWKDCVLLTKRSSHLKHHPGQIAFPGGKRDASDADLSATALREAREEVGLPPENVSVLAELPKHVTVTGFSVTPFLARVTRDFVPVAEAGEVDEIFLVPLAHVLDPTRYVIEGRLWRGEWRRYYAVPYGPYYIWGATARILRGLAERATA